MEIAIAIPAHIDIHLAIFASAATQAETPPAVGRRRVGGSAPFDRGGAVVFACVLRGGGNDSRSGTRLCRGGPEGGCERAPQLHLPASLSYNPCSLLEHSAPPRCAAPPTLPVEPLSPYLGGAEVVLRGFG